MDRWKKIVGESFTVEEFEDYITTVEWNDWTPEFIVLHNTGVPTLKQYPDGINQKYIDILVRYYRDELGWSAGPHLFVDDKQIWVFTPLNTSGVHAPSWNGRSIGIEMLGDYDREEFDAGRGALVRDNSIAAVAILSEVLGIDPDSMKFHREDPKTTHHCPGDNVNKEEFIQSVKSYGYFPYKVM